MRVNFWTLSLSCLLMAFCCNSMVNAQTTQTIYNISGASPVVTNGTGPGTGPTLTDNNDGTFALATAINATANNNIAVNSSDTQTISMLLGRALTADDTVTVFATIDSFAADISNSGVEFGLNTGTGFRNNTDNQYIFQIDDNGDLGGLANGFAGASNNLPNPNVLTRVTEDSIVDGIDLEVNYSIDGILLRVTNVDTNGTAPAGDPGTNTNILNEGFEYLITADEINGLNGVDTNAGEGYDFIDGVGSSFSYFGFQSAGTGARTATISDFSIDVTTAAAVPEPSSIAILSLCATGLLVRRRRK